MNLSGLHLVVSPHCHVPAMVRTSLLGRVAVLERWNSGRRASRRNGVKHITTRVCGGLALIRTLIFRPASCRQGKNHAVFPSWTPSLCVISFKNVELPVLHRDCLCSFPFVHLPNSSILEACCYVCYGVAAHPGC